MQTQAETEQAEAQQKAIKEMLLKAAKEDAPERQAKRRRTAPDQDHAAEGASPETGVVAPSGA